MIKQAPSQKFESECKKAIFCVDNDMPVGSIHDFLMQLKGHMVDLMVKAHKEDQAAAEQQIKQE